MPERASSYPLPRHSVLRRDQTNHAPLGCKRRSRRLTNATLSQSKIECNLEATARAAGRGALQAITQPNINWRVLAIPVKSSYTCRMNYWIFQGNPDIFDIDADLAQSEEIVWQVRQEHLAKQMQSGDEGYLWWAIGRILSGVYNKLRLKTRGGSKCMSQ